MDEYLAREGRERVLGLGPQPRRFFSHFGAARAASRREPSEDPEVELALGVGESGTAGRA